MRRGRGEAGREVGSLVLAATGNGWRRGRSEPKSGARADEVIVNSPEALPVVGGTNVEFGVAGDAAAEVSVVPKVSGELGADGVLEEVMGSRLQGAALALGFAQHTIVRLFLPIVGRERGAQVPAEKFDGEALV